MVRCCRLISYNGMCPFAWLSIIRWTSHQGIIIMPTPLGATDPLLTHHPIHPPTLPGTLRVVLSAMAAFWCCTGRNSEMVNSEDEPRSSSGGNLQCKGIRDVTHNVSQQSSIYPISTHLWKHWGSRLDTEILDIQFNSLPVFDDQRAYFIK